MSSLDVRGKIADQIGAVHVIQDGQEAEAQHDVPVQLSGHRICHNLLFLNHSKQECKYSNTSQINIGTISLSTGPSAARHSPGTWKSCCILAPEVWSHLALRLCSFCSQVLIADHPVLAALNGCLQGVSV